MIEYKFPEEKNIILHYARILGRQDIETIISQGQVNSSDQAASLSRFFWDMTDEIVKDIQENRVVEGQSDLEAWNEYIFESIRAYLRNIGYEKEWDSEADKA